jgi:ankyrin repeat protein
MKKEIHPIFCRKIFLFLFCFFLATFDASAAAQEFSAQIKIQQPESTYYFDYFVKDHLYRLEGKDSSGEPMIIIANRQDDSYIGIHPIMKFYMELSREEIFLFNPIIAWDMITESYKEEKIGTEMIAGFECEKYVYYSQQGETEPSAEVWYSPELNHRVKIVIPLINDGQSTFELLNIQMGSQDEEKFQIPEGYIKMASPTEQAQAGTGNQVSPKASTGRIEGESPMGRTLLSGSIMQVRVNPALEKNLVIENTGDSDASVIVTPFRAGEPISTQVIEKTIALKAKTKPSFSSGLKVDEIQIKVEEGTVRTTVLQESPFTDEIERQEYYLFENFGQGLSLSDDQSIQLTLIGDNQSSGTSQIEMTFFKGEYQDPLEKMSLSLQNGETRQWEFQPGEIKTMDIASGDPCGVKVILEKSTPKKRELSKEEIEQLNQDVMQNNLKAVHTALTSGVDPSLMVFSTDSLLMSACAQGTPDMVSLILDYYPDINYQDMYGNNALTKAAGNFSHYREMVAMLLQSGINPNSKVGSSGQINSTALGKVTTQALQTKSEEDYRIIALFLEKGADANLSTKNGTTPLMQAAYKGNAALVKLFLAYGGDTTLKDKTGKTALDMAKQKGHQEIIQLLTRQ